MSRYEVFGFTDAERANTNVCAIAAAISVPIENTEQIILLSGLDVKGMKAKVGPQVALRFSTFEETFIF